MLAPPRMNLHPGRGIGPAGSYKSPSMMCGMTSIGSQIGFPCSGLLEGENGVSTTPFMAHVYYVINYAVLQSISPITNR